MLRGRQEQCALIDELIIAARSGGSGALVVRGDPGVGKSALLNYAIGQASGFQVISASGVESEMELPFASLQQMCTPLLRYLEALPDPQRAALGTAFGLSIGAAPDRLLVGLAVLGLLSEASREAPLLCTVDDAHWLDQASAQALALAARRLGQDATALLFASRAPEGTDLLAGLPDVAVSGLSQADAVELLSSEIPGRLDKEVAQRVVAEAHGNPLALLEFGRMARSVGGASGFAISTNTLPSRIEDGFRRQVEALPAPAQQFLLLAAADPVGDPGVLARAAAVLGITTVDAEEAEDAGLLDLGSVVRYRHPLVRSAVYRSASPSRRRRAHRALAEATDPDTDPDRRAWHQAEATNGPDDAVADELERSASRARDRGGLAAAAAFLSRAAALTSKPAHKIERTLAAAEAKAVAGAWVEALSLLAGVEAGPLDDLQAARAELVRAQVSQAENDGVGAPALFLSAAGRLRDLDPRRARTAYLDALAEAVRSQVRDEVVRVATAVPPAAPSEGASPTEVIMTGWLRLSLNGYPDGVDLLTEAVHAFLAHEHPHEDELRGLWFACRAAYSGWDYETYYQLTIRYLDVARRSGALSALPRALQTRANALIYGGDLAGARAAIDEAKGISEATGSAFGPARDLGLVALSVPATPAFDQIDAVRREAAAKRDPRPAQKADRVTSVLCNSLGRYAEAVAAAKRYNANHPQGGGAKVWAELIEASVRTGELGLAATTLDRLSERMRRAGTGWALGVEARCRALLAAPDGAEVFYQEAVERFSRARVRLHLARAHLVYGEWLRRQGRRADARRQLRTSLDLFESMGAPNFAERARTELAAAGERAPNAAPFTPELTPQEAQVARLASEGLSNQDIAARLFLSAHTVDFHLRKVFRKFGISSRAQLHQSLSSTASI